MWTPFLDAGRVGDAVSVGVAGDFGDALARLGEGEDALHDGGGLGVRLQPGALLSPVLDVGLRVAVGVRLATQKPREAASRVPGATSWQGIARRGSPVEGRQSVEEATEGLLARGASGLPAYSVTVKSKVVLPTVKLGPPDWTKSRTFTLALKLQL